MIVALTSVGAVVLLVIVHRALIFRLETATRKIAEVLKQERDELEERANQLEAIKLEIDELNAALAKAGVERLRMMRRKKKKRAPGRLFVHEIGGREPGRKEFEFPLKTIPALIRQQPTKVIFHPDIWKFRNEAHVWAADYPVAQMLTSSVFNGASGVVIGSAADDAPEPAEPADDATRETEAGAPDPASGTAMSQAVTP